MCCCLGLAKGGQALGRKGESYCKHEGVWLGVAEGMDASTAERVKLVLRGRMRGRKMRMAGARW